MSKLITLSEPNSVYEDYPISFLVEDDHVDLFVDIQDKSIVLTHEQFEEAVKFYTQKKIEQAKSRMKINNTIVVDYSNGALISSNPGYINAPLGI